MVSRMFGIQYVDHLNFSLLSQMTSYLMRTHLDNRLFDVPQTLLYTEDKASSFPFKLTN